MCYGAESAWIPAVVAAVASTGSAYAANKSNNAQVEANAQAQRNDMIRQEALQKQADATVQRGITSFEPTNQDRQLQAAAANRTAGVANATAATPAAPYQAAVAAAPTEVKSDLGRQVGDALSQVQLQGARKAKLDAYGDTSMQQGFDLNRIKEQLGQLATNSRGMSSIVPYQLLDARLKGRGDANAADLAGALGKIGSYYAINAKKPVTVGTGNAGGYTSPGGYGDSY